MTTFTNAEMGVLNSLVHGVILIEQLLLLYWDYGEFQSLFWVQLKSYSNTHYHGCVALETGNGPYMNGRMVMQLVGVDLRHLVQGRKWTPRVRLWPIQKIVETIGGVQGRAALCCVERFYVPLCLIGRGEGRL